MTRKENTRVLVDDGETTCHASHDCSRCRIRFKCQTETPVTWDEFRFRFKRQLYNIRSIVDEKD